MSESATLAATERGKRREDVLWVVVDETCAHTSEIAYGLNYNVSAVRRDLDWLEQHGYVQGFKHNERDQLPNGRVRIYWSATEAGKNYIAELKARA